MATMENREKVLFDERKRLQIIIEKNGIKFPFEPIMEVVKYNEMLKTVIHHHFKSKMREKTIEENVSMYVDSIMSLVEADNEIAEINQQLDAQINDMKGYTNILSTQLIEHKSMIENRDRTIDYLNKTIGQVKTSQDEHAKALATIEELKKKIEQIRDTACDGIEGAIADMIDTKSTICGL